MRTIAADFLSKFHPHGYIPIPIETIVESDFEIDIVPVPGLKDQIDIDSYPTSDLKEIHVDEYVYKHHENRYRFSLAHEISHVILHKEIFEQLTFSTIEEWKNVVTSAIHPDEYGWIEWQAYTLAGLILVPPSALSTTFQEKIRLAGGAGVSASEISSDESLRAIIENSVAADFVVSAEVIRKRAEAD